MKKALITGASGLLGQIVNKSLQQQGYETIGLCHKTRPDTHRVIASLDELSDKQHIDLIVNLAGAPIASRPWSPSRKAQLFASRVNLTQSIVDALQRKHIHVNHVVSGSAIGFYGPGSSAVGEDNQAGTDFSAELCKAWEAAASGFTDHCEHLSIIRTGLVLHPSKGYLAPLKLTASLGIGAVFGDGEQGQSWIDYRDWLAAVNCIIDHSLSGAFNLTAPNPVTQRVLIDTLAKTLSRPRLFRIPAFALAPAGELKTLFIDGQWVYPEQLLQHGFKFHYPELTTSLTSLLKD